jgi:hypothetical protein
MVAEPTMYHTRGEHTNYYTTDEPMMYHTRGEHTNYYTTDAVQIVSIFRQLTVIQFLINVHFVLLQSGDLFFILFIKDNILFINQK